MNDVGPGIIWSAMPIELVIDGLNPPQQACVTMQVEGRTLEVLPGATGTGTVQRLISGDPQDYLDPRWQPGANIRMN